MLGGEGMVELGVPQATDDPSGLSFLRRWPGRNVERAAYRSPMLQAQHTMWSFAEFVLVLG